VHWAIAALMPALWWTAEHDQLDLHRLLGFIATGLILFRILWGVIGSSTARFTGFLKGPRAIAAYLGDLARGRMDKVVVGHNPLGGWSVAAMLTLLAVDAGLGLFATNEDADQPGPFDKYLTFDQGSAVTQWHHWVFNALVALICLHLAAIVFYAVVKRDNLVGPMLTGSKSTTAEAEAMTGAPLWRFLAAAVIAAAAAVLIARS
jgi:cytochrome b